MANKKFVSSKVARFDVDFSVTNVTAAATINIGSLPKNIIITDGWAYIKTSIMDNGDESTTLSIGYTDAAAGFYPATALTSLLTTKYLKLIPGVLNVGTGEVITTVDTPAEVVGIARVSADTYSGLVLTTAQRVTMTSSNDHVINAGTMSVWVEYLEF